MKRIPIDQIITVGNDHPLPRSWMLDEVTSNFETYIQIGLSTRIITMENVLGLAIYAGRLFE